MVEVRPAQINDVADIAGLLAELDRFYGDDARSPAERVAGIKAALFEEPVAGYALLAWDEDELIGLASYSFLWPAAGISRSLYLKELYVRQDRQRRGVGRRLMDELRQVAVKHRCSRLEWTTDLGNRSAQKFYDQLGFQVNEGKVSYRSLVTHPYR